MAAYRRVYDHVTCRPTTNDRDQLRNPTLGNRVGGTFTLFIQRVQDNKDYVAVLYTAAKSFRH